MADLHRPSELDTRGIAWTLLALSSALVAVYAANWFAGPTPLGDDASSHITTIATFAERLSTGAGWWSDDYNLGFPMGLYYQPLPHLVGALLCIVLGGHGAAEFVFEATSTGLMMLWPWAIYVGLRRAGARHLDAALAGACAPLVMEGIPFGYTSWATLKIGLYTQGWGNVMLPLALGEITALAFRRGHGRYLTTIVASAALAACHMFYAIALVPIVGLFVLIGAATREPGDGWTEGLDVAGWARRARGAFGRLAIAGAGAGVMLAPWLAALATTRSAFGGWPFGRPSRVDGYGFGVVERVVDGSLLDGPNTWAAYGWPAVVRWVSTAEIEVTTPDVVTLPVLTLMAVLGVGLAIGRRGRDRYAALILVLCAWAMFGAIGRAGFGPIVDIWPLHHSVQLFRYGALLQFGLLCACGMALAEGARMATRRFGFVAGLVVILGCLVSPVRNGADQLATGFRTLDDTDRWPEAEWMELAGWLRAQPMGGRVMVGPKTEVRGHYHGGLLAWGGDRPAGQSYGVGLHDSLGFYHLEFLDLDEPSDRVLARLDLFDFRYAVLRPEGLHPGLVTARTLAENEQYRLVEIPGSTDAVTLFRVVDRIQGTPRDLRASIRAWMNGNGPDRGLGVVVDVQPRSSSEALVGAPVRVDDATIYDDDRPPVGEVITSHTDGPRVDAIVRLDEPGLAALEVGWHPFWSVTVNGEPVDTVYAYPCLLGVELPSGEHRIEARFRWPWWSRALWFLVPLPLLFGFTLDRRRGDPPKKKKADDPYRFMDDGPTPPPPAIPALKPITLEMPRPPSARPRRPRRGPPEPVDFEAFGDDASEDRTWSVDAALADGPSESNAEAEAPSAESVDDAPRRLRVMTTTDLDAIQDAELRARLARHGGVTSPTAVDEPIDTNEQTALAETQPLPAGVRNLDRAPIRTRRADDASGLADDDPDDR